MMQEEQNVEKRIEKLNAVSKALSSIYTGVFLIDLINDTYDIISALKFIRFILDGITSAQGAINYAIQKTASQDEVSDVLSFVNLCDLSRRMKSERCLNIDYKGIISGWVRGSFIEVERDSEGTLTQVLYVYQVIDEAKKKELEHLQQLREDYAKSEKNNEDAKQSFEKEKLVLEDTLQNARLANATKTSFLARMSHDMRTPMNGIMGLIEINEKHADDIVFTSENRKKAKVAAKYLLALINDILQLCKLESSTIEISDTPFDMQELLDDIFVITEMRAKDNGITVEINRDESTLQYPYLLGSPLHVRQIYMNILGNAIKYNRKSGKVICSVSADRINQDQVCFTMIIKDTGIGMSEEFQKHLFDPFTREHEKMDGKYEGVGLGLAIVKQLVDKMDGTIQVESKINEGSCFTVEIPFKLASENEIVKEEPEETGNIEGRNILLVEDNELNMEIAEILLTDAGANITKAVNGQQAVDIFRENVPGTFDVILMDIMMPVMNGYEATRCIRSLERTDAKEIPIIAMTANAYIEDVEKAKNAGMNDHLAKPLDVQKMLNVIAKYVKKMTN